MEIGKNADKYGLVILGKYPIKPKYTVRNRLYVK